mmetsp:Transcript_13152/g.37337  ORF Transcript_13152/g.37337 Transcript_13152/m.37337 type:complete len:110 (-) Transcript_13152:41-370(-)|eukprot:CAMPEP_0119127448 /NCGR_PEP_ID=MMETSP1310-20130426/5998_1 /TAXON_ID=464262 /ORGANISM="Genus nov. species nov., Strain RCC2339" /LENGTH=109 /DNA_ID=CAMNT_0007117709 /DNA_START=87 /DNA_END=416 /DNA_ORIENTATION=+
MPKAAPKSKAAQQKAAMSSNKGKKKKWAKAKSKESAVKAVVLDEKIEKAMYKEVPSYKLITTAVVSDRLKINGSLARVVIARLEKEGKIKAVVKHNKQLIYTRAVSVQE